MKYFILLILILLSFGCEASRNETTVPEHIQIFNKGTNYYFGLGTIVDVVKACNYFEQSAEMDYAAAQFNIGNCYRSGVGREKDITRAVNWYKRAIEHGNNSSLISLATINIYELHDETLYDHSVDLLKQAISANDDGVDHAYFILGTLYYSGKVLKQDYVKAMENYRLAAYKGNFTAIALLSHIFSEGLYEVDKDQIVAQEWRSIIENTYDHRNNKYWKYEEVLSTLYDKGIGVPSD